MLRRSLVLLLALFPVACGGDTVVTQGNAHGPAGPVGNIEVRAVPPSITEVRFSGLDAAGNYSFGPITRPRAGQVLLSNVPTRPAPDRGSCRRGGGLSAAREPGGLRRG